MSAIFKPVFFKIIVRNEDLASYIHVISKKHPNLIISPPTD